jgi:hypothetical protein
MLSAWENVICHCTATKCVHIMLSPFPCSLLYCVPINNCAAWLTSTKFASLHVNYFLIILSGSEHSQKWENYLLWINILLPLLCLYAPLRVFLLILISYLPLTPTPAYMPYLILGPPVAYLPLGARSPKIESDKWYRSVSTVWETCPDNSNILNCSELTEPYTTLQEMWIRY